MSSNYKYQGKPLDEIAAIYNPQQNIPEYNNPKLPDVETFKLSDLGYDDITDDINFIKCTDKIANGVWGNNSTSYKYKQENVSIPFTSNKSIIFTGLSLEVTNAEMPISIRDPYSLYISRINDSITYLKRRNDNQHVEFEVRNVKDNRNIHILNVTGRGGNGSNGKVSKDEDNNIIYRGGNGGGASGFCSIMIDISKFRYIEVNRIDSAEQMEIKLHTNTGSDYLFYINDGMPGDNYDYTAAYGRVFFCDTDSSRYELTINNFNNINALLKNKGIFIISAVTGGSGGLGAIHYSRHPAGSRDSSNGTDFPTLEISYSDNMKFSKSGNGGGKKSSYTGDTAYQPGGGGASSYFGCGGDGGGANSSIGNIKGATDGKVGAGGGGGSSHSGYINGGAGGTYRIDLFAEKCNYDTANNNASFYWEWNK